MIETTRIFYYVFGAFTIVGGVIGYLKAHSGKSLIFGSIAGILLLLAAFLLAKNKYAGLGLGMVVALGLAFQFVPSFLEKHKVMPAGIMSVLSVIAIILTGIALAKN